VREEGEVLPHDNTQNFIEYQVVAADDEKTTFYPI
jgi:hypothetical protein